MSTTDTRAERSADVIEVRNPASGELLGTVAASSARDVDAAIAAAQAGKRAMAAMPAYARAELLMRVADGMTAREEELARLLASENGKPILQTRGEVAAAIRIFRGFAEESKRLFGRQVPLDAVPGLDRNLAITIREPLGVVAAIVPFNYPVELYAHKAAAALAAGNAVVVKPPEKCPLALEQIAGIVAEAGAPQAAHQVLHGGPEIAQALARSEGVQFISLTGSTAAGRAIAELAANSLKRVHLELGGNDPMIVCADADVEKAAEAVVLGRLARGNGQICCAVKRVFVEAPVYDEMAERLTHKAEALVVGDPLDERTEVGPLINEAAARAVEASVAESVAQGAELAAGGTRDGAFVAPTVLTGVTPDEPVAAREVFGPVAPLLRVDSADEAVELANASPYGLQASVFTPDIGRAFSLARRLEAGGVVINGSSALRAENLSFGGVKLTGNARESIHDTLLDMSEEKAIIVMDAFT
jgi:acyl-CoA reductase-like NAD-dependent aldehyde dehydrogenase